ncbi:MAG: DUF424 family protein [Candidatus Lokiarchaeota archaeon]|nr:DUF424 family protein [Candidatus Lokiarchaeota archaeon]
MYVYMKVIKRKKDILVASCDDHLLDKTIKEGNLTIKVSSKFYGDKKLHIDDVECINNLKNATMTNLVGKNIIKKAIDLNIIHKSAIIYINGIPHAQSIIC